MLRPTLIVGLGSSGLTIVSEVQKLMYETFGVNRLPICRFLYVETDSSKSLEQTPAGSDIIPLTITVQSLQQAYRELRNNPDLNMDWIEEQLPQQLSYNAQGAGGVRPAGRLLLWGAGNFRKVAEVIEQAFNEVSNPAAAAALDSDIRQKAGGLDPRSPIAYVVGTLVGGTCSGSFIDIGYILRQVAGMGETAPLYGIFVVPRGGLSLAAGYGNAYGAIKELDFFRQPGNFYQETWPNNVTTPIHSLPPYAIVYLMSPEYGRPNFGTMELDGCLKLAALRLFCELIGMSSERGAVLADGMNEGFGFYATFGISAVQYPKYSLMEALGCAQGSKLCDRWLMGLQYLSQTGEKVTINEKEILDESDRLFDGELQRVFSILNTKGAAPGGLESDLIQDLERILRKEEDRPDDFVIRRFTAGKEGNYYAAVNANVVAGQDQLIRAIREFVFTKLTETENFPYLEKLLEQLRVSIDNTLSYWHKCGIPGTANEWNDFVTRQVHNHIFEGQYTWLGRKASVLEDRIRGLLTSLKKFCMIRALETLKSSLPQGSLSTSDRQIPLPTMESLSKARKNMQDALEGLKTRQNAIAKEVKDTSVPIHRVWHSGSFDADMSNLSDAYARRYGVPSLKDVSSKPGWEVLTTTSARDLASLIKVGYEAQYREFLPAVNVVDQAIQRIDLTQQYAERSLAGLLRLNLSPHKGAAGVPRFVLGPAVAPLNSLVDQMRKAGLQDFQTGESGGGHVRALPLLENAVVFYEEQARINPLTMLSALPDMQKHFEQPGVDSSGAYIADAKVWKQQRLAYNVDQRAIITHIQGLTHFALDFAVTWRRDLSGEWDPESVRWPNFPVRINKGIRFCYTEKGGLERDFELDADAQHARQIQKQPGHVEALDEAVRKLVLEQGEEAIGKLYDAEVKPYLQRRYSADQVRAKTDFYFGLAGHKNGLVHLLLAERL